MEIDGGTELAARMRALEARVDACRESLRDESRSVSDVGRRARDIQERAAAVRGSLERLTAELQRLQTAKAIRPIPVPVPAAARRTPPRPACPRRRRLKLVLPALPCLLLLAAAFGHGIKSQALPAAPGPAQPASTIGAQSPAAAEGSPENAALRIVYEHRLPGAERNVLDILGAREASLGPSPWTIECLSEERCIVTFNDGRSEAGEPLYEFDVDLPARTATPAAQTADALRGVLLAQR